MDNRQNRRGLYLQFSTHFVGYDVSEWMLLEQVDDREQLFVFLLSDVWAQFSQSKACVQFKTRHHSRDVDLNKLYIANFSLKGGVLSGEGCSVTSILHIA